MDYTVTIPDEILGYIFSYVRKIDEPGRTTCVKPPSRSSWLGWIKITFVNRRWRRVAIDDATLWTSIYGVLGSFLIGEFLRRSKEVHLRVDTRHYATPSVLSSLRDTISSHHARIACLFIDVAHQNPILDHAITYTFEKLEELEVRGANVPTREVESCNSFLKQCAPSLERLTLIFPGESYLAFDWQYPCLSHLTFLRLYCRIDTTSLINPQFFDILRQMTSLTRLLIQDSRTSFDDISLAESTDYPAALDNLVCLKSVQYMTLIATPVLHEHILRHIRLSPKAHVALLTDSGRYSDAELSMHGPLAHSLVEFLRFHSMSPPYLSAYLRFCRNHRSEPVTVTFGLTQESQPIQPSGWLPRNGFEIAVPDGFIPTILPPHLTHHVRALTLQDAGFSREFGHLSLFPQVERLRFRVHHDRNYMHDIDLPANPAYFPALQLVDFHNEDFNLFTVLTTFTVEGPHVVYDRFLVLEDVLEIRKNMGSPLEAIYLHVAEEIAHVQAGRINETSCKDIRENIVLESVRRLEAIRGIEIVSKDFDFFAPTT